VLKYYGKSLIKALTDVYWGLGLNPRKFLQPEVTKEIKDTGQ
jgi:hypothetical protein